jgi:hypothetical protein
MAWKYWDVVIAVVGFLIQCGLALLGLTLTQWKHKMAFAALVLFGLLVTVVAVQRGIDSANKLQAQLDAIQHNTERPKEHTHVEFIQPATLPGHGLPFAAEEQLAVNVAYRNAGDFPISSSSYGAKIILLDTSRPSHDFVEDQFKTVRLTQLFGLLLVHSAGTPYHSFGGPILTRKDIAPLEHSGRMVAVFGVVRWKDATGEYETHLATFALPKRDGTLNWHVFLENNEETKL